MPVTSVTETMHRLRALERSTRPSMIVLRPIPAIDPKSSIMMPPITGIGMVCSNAPNLPTKAIRMAKHAAQVITTGLKLRVSISAPVTSP